MRDAGFAMRYVQKRWNALMPPCTGSVGLAFHGTQSPTILSRNGNVKEFLSRCLFGARKSALVCPAVRTQLTMLMLPRSRKKSSLCQGCFTGLRPGTGLHSSICCAENLLLKSNPHSLEEPGFAWCNHVKSRSLAGGR